MRSTDRLWLLGQWTLVTAFILLLILVTPTSERILPFWLGIVLCAISPVIVGAAVRAHSKVNNSVKVKVGPAPNPDKRLVDCGIYAYIRHPMYLAAALLILGAAIWRGSYATLAFVVVAVVFVNLKARFEERLLLQAYPDYAAYMTRTGRLLPRIWR
jgi:protein-S-isoprenylcysteine O-methyltransferase Ste14